MQKVQSKRITTLCRRRKGVPDLLKKPYITQQKKSNLSRELVDIDHKLKRSFETQEKEQRTFSEIENIPKYLYSKFKSRPSRITGTYIDDSKDTSEILKKL